MAKARADYTLADVIRLSPKWLVDKQTQKADFSKELSRIHTMMDYGFNRLAKAKFIDVFGEWDISKLPKNEINKRMAEYKPRIRATNALEVTSADFVNRDVLIKASTHGNQQAKQLLEELKSSLEANRRNIQRYRDEEARARQSANNHARSAMNLESQIEVAEIGAKALEGRVNVEFVKPLLTMPPGWLLIRVKNNSFTVMRREPISVVHSNAQAGVCVTLEMGFWAFEFDLFTFRCIAVWNFADGFARNENQAIHPHAHHNGSICWGNVANRAERFEKDRKLPELLALLDSLMTTYGFDNPYISLTSLSRVPRVPVCPQFLQEYSKEFPRLVHVLAKHASPTLIEWIKANRTISLHADATDVNSMYDLLNKVHFFVCEQRNRSLLEGLFPGPDQARQLPTGEYQPLDEGRRAVEEVFKRVRVKLPTVEQLHKFATRTSFSDNREAVKLLMYYYQENLPCSENGETYLIYTQYPKPRGVKIRLYYTRDYCGFYIAQINVRIQSDYERGAWISGTRAVTGCYTPGEWLADIRYNWIYRVDADSPDGIAMYTPMLTTPEGVVAADSYQAPVITLPTINDEEVAKILSEWEATVESDDVDDPIEFAENSDESEEPEEDDFYPEDEEGED